MRSEPHLVKSLPPLLYSEAPTSPKIGSKHPHYPKTRTMRHLTKIKPPTGRIMEPNSKKLFAALAAFQVECPVIEKSESGYGYKYADLAGIMEEIKKYLPKYKLGFYQAINGDSLKTVIFHTETGETIKSDTPMYLDKLEYELTPKVIKNKDETLTKTEVVVIRGFEGMNRTQAMGSVITYVRRYALSSMLGLVTDKDTDANPTNRTTNPTNTAAPARR